MIWKKYIEEECETERSNLRRLTECEDIVENDTKEVFKSSVLLPKMSQKSSASPYQYDNYYCKGSRWSRLEESCQWWREHLKSECERIEVM